MFGDGLSKLKCADIDGDGASEILVVENANVLRCISSSGDDLWSLTLGGKGRLNPEGVASNLPVVADLTGDGYNEVAIGCFAGALVVMDGATGDELVPVGQVLQGAQIYDSNGPSLCALVAEIGAEPVLISGKFLLPTVHGRNL